MNNINLIGYRCCGKSSVGMKLAEVLRRPFVDADAAFIEHTTVSIIDFVAKSGWDEFRKVESQILLDLCKRENIILATGGGVVLNPDNRRVLQVSGVNFWMQIRQETVFTRLTTDSVSATQRPSLSSLSLDDEIALGLKEREPFYREVADHSIVVDDLSVDEIAAQILSQYCGGRVV
ncbi:MAG: shikimate kinase [Deltaproteobacteria bacterium]|nr:MAG: shikimate kinase [Deltaproteobacteria bacterium]